jgi:hypothetical protein
VTRNARVRYEIRSAYWPSSYWVVITHAVVDVDRWLNGKAERAATISAFATEVTDHVAMDGSNNIAITADVHDLAGAQAMMASPSPEDAHGTEGRCVDSLALRACGRGNDLPSVTSVARSPPQEGAGREQQARGGQGDEDIDDAVLPSIARLEQGDLARRAAEIDRGRVVRYRVVRDRRGARAACTTLLAHAILLGRARGSIS